MRFTIVREEFLKGLSIAARAVGSKVANPVLENLKIELDDRGLFITGSNFDLTIRTLIPYSSNDKEIIRNYKEGATLIKTKFIVDIVRKMESEEITLDVIDSTIAVINDNRSEFKLNCVRAEEYPDLDLDPSGTQLSITKADFSLIVSQTAFAASTKEQRPILTAINLEAEQGILTATATDSARMARKQIKIPDGISFIANVPAKMMTEVDKLTDMSTDLNISISDKKALFSLGRTVIATRLIAGDYPNTKKIATRVSNYALEVNSVDIIKAIDRANILSVERENVVDLLMSENGIEVSAKSSQIGSAVQKIDVFKYEGANLRVSFNSEFVLSAIRALDCQDVTLAFEGEMKPFVVKNALDDSVVQVVTPVRTY